MVSDQTNGTPHANGGGAQKQLKREPLTYSGSLDAFESFDVTTVIGREFSGVQLTDLMKSSDADTLLRDLAITGESPFLRDRYLS